MSATPAKTTAALDPATILMLSLAPLFWAGNAIIGRALHDEITPALLNTLRWALALLILLPFSGWVFRREQQLLRHWRRFCLLGLLGAGSYNVLQYMALRTSSPINATLFASSMPLWILLVGRVFYRAPASREKILGALLALAGVIVVLSRGKADTLWQLKLNSGDLYMLLAALCWAFYSWMLLDTKEPLRIRNSWSGFLAAQMAFGVLWSAAFATLEWALLPDWQVLWSPRLVAALVYLAIAPSILAYGLWALALARSGAAIGSLFATLTPLFAALLSLLFLAEWPQWFHLVAFALIASGIFLSAQSRSS